MECVKWCLIPVKEATALHRLGQALISLEGPERKGAAA
jgi:hypothetical protein